MTEDEAKQTRCCGPEGCGKNVNQSATPNILNVHRFCIGSQCMAWRETTKQSVMDANVALQAGLNTNVTEVPDFYCGLAGKP